MQAFLLISGGIRANKRKEFEQTFRLGFSTMMPGCIYNSLSIDINNEGIYHFYSLWPNGAALKTYMDSSDFGFLIGAFNALGFVTRRTMGEVSELF